MLQELMLAVILAMLGMLAIGVIRLLRWLDPKD
jgi:hypothetical protein